MNAITAIPQRWLEPEEAAKYTRMSDIWLRKMRRLNIGPRFSKISHKKVLYDVADLDAWIVSFKAETQTIIPPDVLERIIAEVTGEKGKVE